MPQGQKCYSGVIDLDDPKKLTVNELLVSKAAFVIPDYQRGYDWKGDVQVKELFSDIISCLESENNKALFLGTMIFDISREASDSIVEIIDGQQRFTTIMIALIAARNYVRNVFDSISDAMVEQAHIVYSVAYQKNKGINRLQASHSIRETFDDMCTFEWNGTFKEPLSRQAKKVAPIYKYAYEQIQEYCGDDFEKFQSFMQQLHHNMYIIRIGVSETTEAFEIFERTNARGKGLEVSDLLKNFLFSKDNKMLSTPMRRAWEEIAEDAGSHILRVLKYFYVATNGRVSSRDLYRKLKEYADKVGVDVFVNELKAFSTFFRCFNSKDPAELLKWVHDNCGLASKEMYAKEIVRSSNAIKAFGVTQPIPLFYAAIESYKSAPAGTIKDAHLINLFRHVEMHHFINNKVCERIGNDVESLYATYSADFSSDRGFRSVQEDFDRDLSRKTAGKEEFISQFSDIKYVKNSGNLIIKYVFDMLANKGGIKEGARVPIIDYYNIENRIQSAYDVEHLYPQSAAGEGEDFVHEIGNLLVIPKQINGSLNDVPFPLKIKRLRNPADYKQKIVHVPPYLTDFLNEVKDIEEWSERQIKERSKALAEQCYSAAVSYHYKSK